MCRTGSCRVCVCALGLPGEVVLPRGSRWEESAFQVEETRCAPSVLEEQADHLWAGGESLARLVPWDWEHIVPHLDPQYQP